ncbi:MAG: hypothetical protein ACD_50C00344G0001 [uncultured bacterium]|nr:MAG: hypothetical protein ACD_50C00344G0001 [uncultured bacterium]OGH13253.1 MAG: hypothetical protein A2687_03875 [Candidatus Levybacteria bacterium RIFCSPHIGHO2_01_FULL_38_26]
MLTLKMQNDIFNQNMTGAENRPNFQELSTEPSPFFTAEIDLDINPENIKEIVGFSLDRTDHLPIEREKLEGRVALVTGSSRGIGAATARLFGEYGMKVVVNSRGRSKEQGEQVAGDVIKAGGDAIWVGADVSEPRDAERLVNEAYGRFNRLDVVVHNAGVRDDALIYDMEPEQWSSVMRSNSDSALFVSKFAVNKMNGQQPTGGNMVYVSSAAVLGLPSQGNYAASKSAMEIMAVVMGRENRRKNLNVSIIRPGFVDTDLTASLTPRQRERLINLSPAKRSFAPEEIARGIAYLSTIKGKTVPIMTVF